jgi:hypothetical protein
MIASSGLSWDALLEPAATLVDLDSDRILRFVNEVKKIGRRPVTQQVADYEFLRKIDLIQNLQHLKSKPYTYGKHLVPHDAGVHEYSSGLSRVEVAKNHGIHFTMVPDISINEGIDAVRNLLNRCWFDEMKCAKGITALENYKKQWNDRHGCWPSHPLHNFASHGADAFRMLAVGIRRLENKGLSTEEWRSLRANYMV